MTKIDMATSIDSWDNINNSFKDSPGNENIELAKLALIGIGLAAAIGFIAIFIDSMNKEKK